MLFILLVYAMAGAWTLNDVSVLLPLPNAPDKSALLSPRSDGGSGPLLPQNVYDNLPRLLVGADPREVYDDQLRVIALRFDPCFKETGGPQKCRHQIRLVWQPVFTGGPRPITADAAAHTFYDLDDAAWANLLREFTPLTTPDSAEALDVHPRIRREGLNGPHWTRLRGLVLRYAGERNLTRATAMSVNPIGSVWAFTGVDVVGGRLVRLPIPRTDKRAQAVQADVRDLENLRVRLAPTLDAKPSWLETLFDSPGAVARIGEEGVREAWLEALRLENPRRTDTGNVDCASCHLAQAVHLWGRRNFPRWSPGADVYPVEFVNNSVNPGLTNRLRAFGYMNDEPVFSQRVIHESAEVLERMRAGH